MSYSESWERFIAVAQRKSVDQVPVALIVDSPWMPGYLGMNTIDYFVFPDRWLKAYLTILEQFPGVAFVPGFWPEYGMAAEPSAYGVPITWHADSPPGIHHLTLPPDRWGDLPRPNPQTDGLMPFVLRRLIDLEKNGGLPEPHRVRMVAARGPLTLATHVLGVTEFLEATALEPEAVQAALEIFTDVVIAFLQAQLDCLREPQGILVLDDIVGMLSPRAYQRLALPYLQRIFQAFDGLIRIYHNDTPCPHLLEHLPAAGFDVFNFSHTVDVADVRSKMGPGVVLMGNVAPLGTLVQGTPEQVEAEGRACIAKLRGKGLILSAGGGLSPGTPGANIQALINAAKVP